MASKMSWKEMVEAACDSVAPKFMSRMAIKAFLTKNNGFTDTPTNKVFLKKALSKLDKKGDSFRKKKSTKNTDALKAKKAAAKAKAAAKKQACQGEGRRQAGFCRG